MAAAISTSVASSPSPALLKHRMRAPTVRCFASLRDGRRAPPLLQLAVGGVTELLRLLSPKKQRDEAGSAEQAPSLARSVDDVVRILRADYDRAYFLTGDFTLDIYAADCLFEDPTIKFRGSQLWNELRFSNMVYKSKFNQVGCILLFRLNYQLKPGGACAGFSRTYLKLPWRPVIAIKGTTTYDIDKDFKIIRHAESWNISALEAVGQIFKLGSVVVDE